MYKHLGWDEALGSSGTNKAIGDICVAMKLTKGDITRDALAAIRERMLQAGRIDAIELPALSKERKPIIAGGLLVLEAVFAALGLERMDVSKAALREGVLYDMLGRGSGADSRDASVQALMQRYGIDVEQAGAGRSDRADAVRPRGGRLAPRRGRAPAAGVVGPSA